MHNSERDAVVQKEEKKNKKKERERQPLGQGARDEGKLVESAQPSSIISSLGCCVGMLNAASSLQGYCLLPRQALLCPQIPREGAASGA